MSANAPPLICPRCAEATAERCDVWTVAPNSAVSADFAKLRCENPKCGAIYPVLEAVPIVLAHLDGLLAADVPLWGLLQRDPALWALLAEAGPDSTAVARGLEHLSIYLGSHWGDRAVEAPGLDWTSSDALRQKVASWLQKPVDFAIELGAGPGRMSCDLAARAASVVALERSWSSLRIGRALAAGEPFTYAQRQSGRHYRAIDLRAAPRAASNVEWVCGDALNPPYAPGQFDRVVALNLIDAVTRPLAQLAVLDRLCAIGGDLVIASPFAWQSEFVAEEERFGGGDPAGALAHWLESGEGLPLKRAGKYAIAHREECDWVLRRDARSAVHYSCAVIHAVRLE